MKRRVWQWGLGLLVAGAIVLISSLNSLPLLGLAQSPAPEPSPVVPTLESTPTPAIGEPSPPATTPPGAASPPAPQPTNLPPVTFPAGSSLTPPAPPASTAPPAALGGDYQDPNGRFRVGVLTGYKVNPLAGSVLIESPDGSLAYTVVPQSQPTGVPIGFGSGLDNDVLAKVATSVFQRGEGFQPGIPRPEAGGGVVIDWTGTLTIAGQAQPVGGVILVRSSAKNILLLLIAATQSGSGQVPSAIAALEKSLQPF
ncbi:hypothetical protein ACN4EK_24910 [Pantanalinema rosaneae CENA516]|uniref:hypothetical protein n=1 Tax=Pantanalinema rosaneae TaxID=1620701 RepID=UPI003D6F3A99